MCLNSVFKPAFSAIAMSLSVVIALASSASAQNGLRTQLPRVGFNYQSIGWGLQVTGVTPGSPAQQIGLEAGDVITQVNGMNLNTLSWTDALQRALTQGPQIRLTIRDVLSGNMAYRDVYLGGVTTTTMYPPPAPPTYVPFYSPPTYTPPVYTPPVYNSPYYQPPISFVLPYNPPSPPAVTPAQQIIGGVLNIIGGAMRP